MIVTIRGCFRTLRTSSKRNRNNRHILISTIILTSNIMVVTVRSIVIMVDNNTIKIVSNNINKG